VLRIRIRIILGSRLRHQSEKLDPDPHQVKIQELWGLKMESWTLTWKRGGSQWSRGRPEDGTGSIIVKSRKRKRIGIRIYMKNQSRIRIGIKEKGRIRVRIMGMKIRTTAFEDLPVCNYLVCKSTQSRLSSNNCRIFIAIGQNYRYRYLYLSSLYITRPLQS
jgi:hypothetical protein